MRVGIDGKCLLPPRAGVARYLEGLLGACADVEHPDLELEVRKPPRPRRTLPWVLLDMQRATSDGWAAFHFAFYYPPLRPRCPVTVAIHDVLVLEHPEWFPHAWANVLRCLLPAGARRAAAIMTGSASVAAAIAEHCRVPLERIHLTGYGVDPRRFAPAPADAAAAACRALGLERPFLLQLGAVESRRGVDLAIAAVAALRRRQPDLELVLVGPHRAPQASGGRLPPWVRRFEWVEDPLLPGLFASALAVVAPSRGEGFDLPVLEALACGAVVVASDIAVHREHFSPAVELFASGDTAALETAIAHVLGDSERAAELRCAGPRLAAGFTWEEVARRHLAIWREVGAR
jgi:glycosyltransferase involved in cell wall biosynthesis